MTTNRVLGLLAGAILVLGLVLAWQFGSASRPASAPNQKATVAAAFTQLAATEDARVVAQPPATPATGTFELPREWRKLRWIEHPQPIQRAADAPPSKYTWSGAGEIFQLTGPEWALSDERNGELIRLLDEGRILEGHSGEQVVVDGMVGDGFVFVCTAYPMQPFGDAGVTYGPHVGQNGNPCPSP